MSYVRASLLFHGSHPLHLWLSLWTKCDRLHNFFTFVTPLEKNTLCKAADGPLQACNPPLPRQEIISVSALFPPASFSFGSLSLLLIILAALSTVSFSSFVLHHLQTISSPHLFLSIMHFLFLFSISLPVFRGWMCHIVLLCASDTQSQLSLLRLFGSSPQQRVRRVSVCTPDRSVSVNQSV